MNYGIGIDIGGTKIASGIVSQEGVVIEKRTVSTPNMGKEEIIAQLASLIIEWMDWCNIHEIPIKGIGIGTAGQVDSFRGKVVSGTPNIKNWNGVNLREKLAKCTDLPIYVDNDVNVVALAESTFGAARGYGEVICLTLGTGVGGSVLTKGELLRGEWGGAAELGHMSIDINGECCNCGLRGCLETYASGTWIAKRMQKACRERGLADKLTSRDVFSLYHQGDPLAKQVMQTMITGLSYGIINLVHIFNPQVVVLGGGVMDEGQWIIDLLKEEMQHLGMRSMTEPIEIKTAELRNDAGLIGAAIQTWKQ